MGPCFHYLYNDGSLIVKNRIIEDVLGRCQTEGEGSCLRISMVEVKMTLRKMGRNKVVGLYQLMYANVLGVR